MWSLRTLTVPPNPHVSNRGRIALIADARDVAQFQNDLVSNVQPCETDTADTGFGGLTGLVSFGPNLHTQK